jgi:molybdate transport system ATP-binding protein
VSAITRQSGESVFWVISEYRVFGGQANFRVELNPHRQFALSMSVPLHVVKRDALAKGEVVGLSLLAEGIHLMPYLAAIV